MTADLESFHYITRQIHEQGFASALRMAALFRLADHLADGPRRISELAKLAEIDEDFLRVVMQLLAVRGVFRETADGSFALTPQAGALRSDAQPSARQSVLTFTSEPFTRAIANLDITARTGKPSFEAVHGMPLFQYMAMHPDMLAEFHQGMENFTHADSAAFAEAYDFPATGLLVDIGGGKGQLLLDVLSRFPGLRGVLFDRADVVAINRLAELGDGSRWEVTAGDFLEAVPSGGDLYVLQFVLHNWDEDSCVKVLRNCRQAMAPGGRVLVLESLFSPQNEIDLLVDMVMRSSLTGKKRREEDFRRLFGAAGLRLSRVIPKPNTTSVIIEGVADPES
jgi:hypothetical protein